MSLSFFCIVISVAPGNKQLKSVGFFFSGGTLYPFSFQQQTTKKKMCPGQEKHASCIVPLQEDTTNSLIDKFHHI